MAFSAPFRQETSSGIEFLDAIIAFIGHINIADKIDRHAARKEEGAVKASVTAPLQQWLAVGLKFLDARVARVGDIHMAVLIRCNAPGHIEAAHIGPPPGKPELAPCFLRVTLEIELLYPVVAAISHIHNIARPDRQTTGIVKLAFL